MRTSGVSFLTVIFTSFQPLLPHTGMGRLCTLSEPVSLSDVMGRIKSHLKLLHIRLALGTGKALGKGVRQYGISTGIAGGQAA